MRHSQAIVAILLCVLSLGTAPAQEPSWTVRASNDVFPSIWDWPKIPNSDIYEVAPTRISTARSWHLDKEPFAEVSCDTAKWLTGHHFKCDAPNKRPFLVRAVYENGGTGQFSIHHRERTLFIYHGSLGPSSDVINLPLVVNLPFSPTKLYLWTGGAM